MIALREVASLQPMSAIPIYFLAIKGLLCCKHFKNKKRLVKLAHDRLESHLDIVRIIER